jgi:hypothetical protein
MKYFALNSLMILTSGSGQPKAYHNEDKIHHQKLERQ